MKIIVVPMYEQDFAQLCYNNTLQITLKARIHCTRHAVYTQQETACVLKSLQSKLIMWGKRNKKEGGGKEKLGTEKWSGLPKVTQRAYDTERN